MSDDEDGRLSKTIQVERVEHARALLGRRDSHLRLLRDAFGIRIVMRGNVLMLEGDEPSVLAATRAIHSLLQLLGENAEISPTVVEHVVAAARRQDTGRENAAIDVFSPRRKVHSRTSGQSVYVGTMLKNDLVFCVGPAGSGKTYLAVAMAVSELKSNRVRKIILARPAVEAGEKLGFLPGDMQAKVNPYLRPLYDALQDMMEPDQVRRYLESDLLEVAPLAYMRGRTLDHAFIILDEGQNCTHKQMKMFLTRLGASSRCVVTGDISQIDLPASEVSGMIESMRILRNIKGIGFVRLSQTDIVRHRLVQDIVNAYEATSLQSPDPDHKTGLQR